MTFSYRLPAPNRSLRPMHSPHRPGLLPTTGPIPHRLSGHVLLVVDAENLALSARDLGTALDLKALKDALLCNGQRRIDCHAVYSESIRDRPLAAHLLQRGWHPTPRPPIKRQPGNREHCNADNWFVFAVARLLSMVHFDGVILGTGDGLLGLDVARCIRALMPKSPHIATLSFPNSTSRLLDARRAPEIDSNILIGRDALRSLH